ncbi:MAG TPA: Fic family protein [Myxococcales bacterium]|jgi:Fic family protein
MPSYIYDRAGWPDFRWDAAQLSAPLAAVSRHQGRLIGRMEALGWNLRADTNLESLAEEVVKSSDIEGEVLDKAQVRSSLALRLGMDAPGVHRAERNVEGIVTVMLDATQKFGEPLTARRLFGWHAALFPSGYSGMTPIVVGRFRTAASGPMQIVSGPVGKQKVHYEAPSFDRLAAEMRRFLVWFEGKQSVDPLLKAAISHVWFVTIHPFDDGNGRIARAIADMALARAENTPHRFYSMSAQIRAERDAYYSILEATQKGGLDITRWLLWFLGCLDRSFSRAENVHGQVMRKARFWDAHAAHAFNDRQRAVLNRLLDGFVGKLTSSKWAALTKTSQDTASRDISDLIERGILVKDPAGGRSTSYSLA